MPNHKLPRYIIGTDTETSGEQIPGQIKPGATPSQCLSIGVILLDSQRPDLPEVASFYREIRFDGSNYRWESWTEDKHGLTREHLADAPTMSQVGNELADFLSMYINPDERNLLLAHNPGFDRAFIGQVLASAGRDVRFSYRALDAFSLGYGSFGLESSDEQFAFLGQKRSAHNALDDIRLSAEILREARRCGNRKLLGRCLPPAGTPEYARGLVKAYLLRHQKEGTDFRGLCYYWDHGIKLLCWCEYGSLGLNNFYPADDNYAPVIDRMIADGLIKPGIKDDYMSENFQVQYLEADFLNID